MPFSQKVQDRNTALLAKMGRFMATLPHRVCSPTMVVRAAVVAGALPLLAAGCASRTYRAANLPATYLAPVTRNVQELNLSKLADYSVSSQRIDVGDVLEVTILTDSTSDNKMPTVPVVIERDGTANIPPIGKVHLAGLDLEEAGPRIAADGVARQKFQRPHVTVEMKRQRTNYITVIGAVEETGLHELPRSRSSLLAAISEAGGLSEDAGDVIEIRRPPPRDLLRAPYPPQAPHVASGPRAELTGYRPGSPGVLPPAQVTEIDLFTAATQEGYVGGDLMDGDIVHVRKRAPKPVYVLGLVQKPDKYDMPTNYDLHLLEALSMAGGCSLPVADKVIIRRMAPDEGEPVVIVASISAAKRGGADNVRLAPGDVVSVEETPATIVMRTFTQVLRIGIGSSFTLF